MVHDSGTPSKESSDVDEVVLVVETGPSRGR